VAGPAPQASPSEPRPVQRAVQIDEIATQTNVSPQATPQATPAAAAGAAQDTEQLREQVLRWVRSELLVNRERAGRLTDLR
jgi:hypothetical protein